MIADFIGISQSSMISILNDQYSSGWVLQQWKQWVHSNESASNKNKEDLSANKDFASDDELKKNKHICQRVKSISLQDSGRVHTCVVVKERNNELGCDLFSHSS